MTTTSAPQARAVNVHFHTLAADGTWTFPEDGTPTFQPARAPSEEETEALTDLVAARVRRMLVRRGLWIEDQDGGAPTEVDVLPALADVYEASVAGRAGSGERRGRSLRRVGTTMALEPGTVLADRRRAHGFDLHAGVAVRKAKRERLEHLCRYLLRPALANDRLKRLPGGDLLLTLKRAWRDGTTHLRLTPHELMERLCALIPRPRANQILYHGVYAPNAKHRPDVVPTAPADPLAERAPPRGPNHGWAELMRRGLSIDSLECPRRCGGRLAFLACIDQPKTVRRILEHLSLPAEPIRTVPARAPPEQEQWSA